VTGRPGRWLRLLTLLVAVLMLSSAAAFAAKKPQRLKQAGATASATGSFNIAQATATCPARTHAVGGGYVTSIPSIPNHWLNVYESQRISRKQWRVSGVEYFPAPATDSLVAYAYCESVKRKVITARTSVPLTSTLHGTSSVLALCPAGTRSLSGGFSTPASTSAAASYVSRSTAAGGNGWVVDATNLNGTSARTVVSSVYCVKAGAHKLRFGDVAVVGSANAVGFNAMTPPCPKGTIVRGGGFATSTPVGGLQATALVYASRRAGSTWLSSASTSGNATSSTLVSTAICR
jgi:hypothetical protein